MVPGFIPAAGVTLLEPHSALAAPGARCASAAAGFGAPGHPALLPCSARRAIAELEVSVLGLPCQNLISGLLTKALPPLTVAFPARIFLSIPGFEISALHSDVDFWFFQNCKVALRKITLEASSGRGMHLANMALEDKLIKMCEKVD